MIYAKKQYHLWNTVSSTCSAFYMAKFSFWKGNATFFMRLFMVKPSNDCMQWRRNYSQECTEHFSPFLSPDVLPRMMRWVLLEHGNGRPVAGKTDILKNARRQLQFLKVRSELEYAFSKLFISFYFLSNLHLTRKHSSRMRTARLETVRFSGHHQMLLGDEGPQTNKF